MAAGFPDGGVGDCVTRAFAIASGLPYAIVHAKITTLVLRNNPGRRRTRTADSGIPVSQRWFKDYMKRIGFVWVPACDGTRLVREHIPAKGRLIVSMRSHYVAVIDGTIRDFCDPRNASFYGDKELVAGGLMVDGQRQVRRKVDGWWEFTR